MPKYTDSCCSVPTCQNTQIVVACVPCNPCFHPPFERKQSASFATSIKAHLQLRLLANCLVVVWASAHLSANTHTHTHTHTGGHRHSSVGSGLHCAHVGGQGRPARPRVRPFCSYHLFAQAKNGGQAPGGGPAA